MVLVMREFKCCCYDGGKNRIGGYCDFSNHPIKLHHSWSRYTDSIDRVYYHIVDLDLFFNSLELTEGLKKVKKRYCHSYYPMKKR